jgi:uncharacterized iron-regulated protein
MRIGMTIGLIAGLAACQPAMQRTDDDATPARTADGTVTAVAGGSASEPALERADAAHPLAGTVWAVARGAAITPEALAAQLTEVDFAILGELHDSPVHHRRQAWLVERIAPQGLAFEMIPEGSEDGIAVFRAQGGAVEEIGPAIGWDRLGWPDWPLYAPIFAAAPEAYVAGGGVERRALRGAMRTGAGSAFGAEPARWGLDRPLPVADRTAMEDEMVASHCGMLPRQAAGGMVEAQRLRDARFARAAVRAAERGGGRVVLITGNGHARTDRGVPAYLAQAAPERTVLSLGQIEVSDDARDFAAYAGALPYDYVWFSKPAERGDPCAAFR